MKKIYVCTTCGSPRVTFDATVDPNNNFDVVNVLDSTDCNDCEGRCGVARVEVPDDFDMDEGFHSITGEMKK